MVLELHYRHTRRCRTEPGHLVRTLQCPDYSTQACTGTYLRSLHSPQAQGTHISGIVTLETWVFEG